MLRALVLLLALANLGFYVWTQGWLDGVVGLRASGDREPERLARQVRPETVRILPPAASAPQAVPATLACLEAGPFGNAEVAAAEVALQASLPAGRWTSVQADQPGSWIVFMGKYPNRDAMVKKEEELKRRKVDYEEVTANADLGPGALARSLRRARSRRYGAGGVRAGKASTRRASSSSGRSGRPGCCGSSRSMPRWPRGSAQ